MFGFRKNKINKKSLEEKYLNKTESDFKKWIQNTYEVLSYEQLECVSKFAKEVYNINDEELTTIIATRPNKYFPVRTEPIPPPPTSRGKRREMKVYDDASLMDKKEMDSILLKWTIDGKDYQAEVIIEESPKKYTLKDKDLDKNLLEKNRITSQIKDIVDKSRNNKLSITEVENMLEDILEEFIK